MKNLLFTFALLVTFSCTNVNKENDLKDIISSDLKFSNNKEFNNVMDLMNPNLFEVITRILPRISSDLKKFSNYSNNKEFDKVMDLMNPNLFEVVTREELIQSWENLGTEVGMNNKLGIPVITNISEIYNFKQNKYLLVNYTGDLTTIISGQLLLGIDVLKEGIISKYSPKSASFKFEESTNTFYFKELQQSMIGMAKANSNDWRYVQLNNAFIKDILPLEVIEKFK